MRSKQTDNMYLLSYLAATSRIYFLPWAWLFWLYCLSTSGGGGGLHNIRWNPDHIRHIACAGRLYSLLLQQQEGIHFLQTDARGGVLQVTE